MSAKIVSASLIVLALGGSASAQTKISGTCVCKKPEKHHSMDIGDRAGHAYAIAQAKCAWSKPLELEGIQSKEGVTTGIDEVTGNSASSRGMYIDTMANGDKCNVRFQGKATLKDDQYQAAEGTWSYVGGTGKFKGLKGKGTYKGTGAADGSVTYEIEGEYQLPAPKK